MTTIQSSGFARELGRDGGAINVNDLSPEMEKALADAGVRLADLRRAAGSDGQIRGDQEWAKLFKLVDRFDSDGNAGTFLARDAAGTETKAGALYDELKAEADRHRLAAQTRGIIHFGMRPESYREADKLAAVNASCQRRRAPDRRGLRWRGFVRRQDPRPHDPGRLRELQGCPGQGRHARGQGGRADEGGGEARSARPGTRSPCSA